MRCAESSCVIKAHTANTFHTYEHISDVLLINTLQIRTSRTPASTTRSDLGTGLVASGSIQCHSFWLGAAFWRLILLTAQTASLWLLTSPSALNRTLQRQLWPELSSSLSLIGRSESLYLHCPRGNFARLTS